MRSGQSGRYRGAGAVRRLALAGLLLLSGRAGAQTTDPLAVDATLTTLDNGLHVVLVEGHRTDSIALHLSYGVGAADEREGEHGCAHLFEHLMFEGSAHVPTNAFDDWLTAAGGDNNAWTSADETAYHMRFPSGALDLALFLESDRMGFLDAGLDEANLANQQAVVLQERYQGHAEPHGRDWDAMTRLLYPEGHPYHVPVIGTVEDVQGFTLEQVRDFWERHYRSRDAVLVLVGHFRTDEALARVRHWFSDVPDRGGRLPEPRLPPELPELARVGLLVDEVQDRGLVMGWRTPAETEADHAALELLGWVLSGGRGTRLEDELYYERRHLTTEAWAAAFGGALQSEFLIAARTERRSPQRVARIAQRVIDDLQKHPPTDAELERARRMIRAEMLDAQERNESLAAQLAWCQRSWSRPDCAPALWSRLQAVQAADVQRVARDYLSADRRATLYVLADKEQRMAPREAEIVEVP